MSASRSDRFLAFSAEVAAYTVFDLQGTGLAEAYLSAATNVVGEATLDELFDAYDQLLTQTQADQAAREELLRKNIFGNEKFGPIARNIIKLWFIGIWFEMPRAWIETFGASDNDHSFMVSRAAYAEGLLWQTIGAHPPGAKAPGYGSWTEAPQFPAIP